MGNSNDLDRRTLLQGAAAGVATAAASAALPARAEDKKALQDSSIQTESITFKNGADTINGFIARPKAPGKHGTVIVIPDIFGMSPYIRETTAQVAQAGLAALCVDFYSRKQPPTEDFAALRTFVPENAPDRQIVSDAEAGIAYMKKQPYANGKFGVVGFCMGGRITLLLAAMAPEIVAASPYYGPVKAGGPSQIAPMDVAGKIRGAVQGHYGATDAGIKPDDVRAFEAKLKESNPHAEFFIYEGAGHAFHSFGRPSYNAEAASKAWARTLQFFQQHLK